MAHEVGHLLLPKNSHSNVGIMREDLDLKSLLPLVSWDSRLPKVQTLGRRCACGRTEPDRGVGD